MHPHEKYLDEEHSNALVPGQFYVNLDPHYFQLAKNMATNSAHYRDF